MFTQSSSLSTPGDGVPWFQGSLPPPSEDDEGGDDEPGENPDEGQTVPHEHPAEKTLPRFPMPEIMFQQYPEPRAMTETWVPSDDEWP